MDTTNKRMVAKECGVLQIPYSEYVSLRDQVEQVERMRDARDSVVAELKKFEGIDVQSALDAVPSMERIAAQSPKAAPAKPAKAKEPVVEAPAAPAPVEEKAPAPVEKKAPASAPSAADGLEVPPIKKDIAAHFNKLDESGRLFGVFQQYYACLHNACGGTVRVTMKDGFCSFWNYDEWEEFAFVDIFEGRLRFSIDPRYTDSLQSLDSCAVPRLLSSRRSLVCVQVDDLNNTMLDILTTAFKEVGLAAS